MKCPKNARWELNGYGEWHAERPECLEADCAWRDEYFETCSVRRISVCLRDIALELLNLNRHSPPAPSTR